MMCSCFEVTCKLGHHIYLTPGPVILTPGLDRFSQDGTYDLTEDKVPCKLLTGPHIFCCVRSVRGTEPQGTNTLSTHASDYQNLRV